MAQLEEGLTHMAAPSTDARTKQRLTRLLIQEAVLDLEESANEAIITVHWVGGRHTEIRVARVRAGRYPDDRYPSPVEVIRTMGGRWPDRQLAVTMNRMRCKSSDGESWTTVRVRALRERLGVPPFDPATAGPETISVDETARRLQMYQLRPSPDSDRRARREPGHAVRTVADPRHRVGV